MVVEGIGLCSGIGSPPSPTTHKSCKDCSREESIGKKRRAHCIQSKHNPSRHAKGLVGWNWLCCEASQTRKMQELSEEHPDNNAAREAYLEFNFFNGVMVDCSNVGSSWNSPSTSSDDMSIASSTVVDTSGQGKGGTDSDWDCILTEVCQERPTTNTTPNVKKITLESIDSPNRKPCMSALGIHMCDCEEDSMYCNLVTCIASHSDGKKATFDRASQEKVVPEEMESKNHDCKNCWHVSRKKQGKCHYARTETVSSDNERASGSELGNSTAIAAWATVVLDSHCRASKLTEGFVEAVSPMKGFNSITTTKGRTPTIASHLELTESALSQGKLCSIYEEDTGLEQHNAQRQALSLITSTLRTQLAGLKLDVGRVSVTEPAPDGTLHGVLHCTLKDGLPNYTFLLDDYEEVLTAKIWLGDMKVGRHHEVWKYSFYTLREEKKRKGKSGWKNWRRKDKLHATVVGKMKVSSVLCSDGKNKLSVKSKCILFSPRLSELTMQEEASASVPDHSSLMSLSSPACATALWQSSSPTFAGVERSRQATQTRCRNSIIQGIAFDADTQSFPDCLLNSSSPQHAELAAMLINVPVPLQVQDSLVMIKDQHLEAGITVILPSGKHGRPLCDMNGPSPLIRRWKEGGKCDCKGWDLGCGLMVLSNSRKRARLHSESSKLRRLEGAGHCRTLKLYKQDTDQEEAFFSLSPQANGLLGLDFCAPLSPLQAFAIAVATLHGRDSKVSQRASDCTKSTVLSQGMFAYQKDKDPWSVEKGNMTKLQTTQTVDSKLQEIWQHQIAINNFNENVHASKSARFFERL
ncbi:hypothetical protein GOP47_0013496 [Adiantum capillus-veneris]|uniref:Uncharacterized protein n=1 Tax=Adiantum capillus-veneris TaxID=13818 RepID=A0A9D4ZFD1_ADICA|nr:hypothetical protein GOP47_0013496 [Adiantum capillus-veneris]